jgi:hypothetical protein
MNTPKPVGQGDAVVEAGESLVSIAARAGHLPETIWNDPANAELKQARKDGEVLLPGDRLTLMPLRQKSVVCVTGKRHVFRRKAVPVKLTLVLEDEEGHAFASKRCELVVDGTTISGTSDDKGKIEYAVDPLSRSATLSVWLEEPGLPNPWVRDVGLSALCPVDHPVGVQQRLANLGFYRGALDGVVSAETLAALVAFQKEQGLAAADGDTIDDATLAKLAEVHKT